MLESDPLERIQTRRHLEDINQYVLQGAGEIRQSPGKLSLVWLDASAQAQRYLAVKPAGDEAILINGRRYPATREGLRQGLREFLTGLH
mgnify:CR=1 FL=1